MNSDPDNQTLFIEPFKKITLNLATTQSAKYMTALIRDWIVVAYPADENSNYKITLEIYHYSDIIKDINKPFITLYYQTDHKFGFYEISLGANGRTLFCYGQSYHSQKTVLVRLDLDNPTHVSSDHVSPDIGGFGLAFSALTMGWWVSNATDKNKLTGIFYPWDQRSITVVQENLNEIFVNHRDVVPIIRKYLGLFAAREPIIESVDHAATKKADTIHFLF